MPSIIQHALLLVSLAQVSVNLAPDQPIAQVYSDELLVVEFVAQGDTEFTADMTLTRAGAAPVTVNFGSLAVQGGSPRWVIVPGVPWQRGFYHARIETRVGNGSSVTHETFCRVDRPTAASRLPLCVSVDDLSRETVLRLRGLSTETVSLDGLHPDFYALLDRATQAGFQVRVRLDSYKSWAKGDDLTTLIDQVVSTVALWELAASDDVGPPMAIARAIRSRAPTARLALRLSNPDHLGILLAEGAGLYVDTITIDAPEPGLRFLQSFRRQAEHAGYERLAFEQLFDANDPVSPLAGPVASLRKGYDRIILIAAPFLSDGKLDEGYCYASTLAQRLGDATFLGDVAIDDNTVGQLFVRPRPGEQASAWTFYIDQNDVAPIHLTTGNAEELRLFDALNNATPIDRAEDGTVTLSTVEGPLILTGIGGVLPREAAASSIRGEARALLAMEGVSDSLGAERTGLLKAFAACDGLASMRVEFFGLLRALPDIESRWHKREMARSTAVPLLAGLSRLARTACALEQEIGTPFLEPIDKTYARCAEFQSRYLSGTGGGHAVQERGEWLLGEVQRLIDESRALLGRGRRIEADAVAALAEWRARSLSYTAQAMPLSEPDQYVKESE